MQLNEWTIGNDCHIGSKYNDDPSLKSKLIQLSNNGRTALLGDIGDLACCKNKDVDDVQLFVDHLKTIFGKKYVFGNHEREGMKNRFFVQDNIFFTHGDLDSDYDKWSKYRLKKKGAAWYKLPFIAILDGLDFFKDKRPLPNGFLQRAAAIALENNCHTYVCGHFHPVKMREYIVNGVRIVVLPAGINKVML